MTLNYNHRPQTILIRHLYDNMTMFRDNKVT